MCGSARRVVTACLAIEHAFAGDGQLGGDRCRNQGATKRADRRGHLLDLSGFSVYVTPRIDIRGARIVLRPSANKGPDLPGRARIGRSQWTTWQARLSIS